MSHQGNQDDMPQPPEEDSSDDGLWNEFESCATSVTHLYRNANWRTLQSAAASTTQLYKHGLDMKKRSFDRGFSKGRLALAREISTMCRYKHKVDVTDIVALLSKYELLPAGGSGVPGTPAGGGGGQSPRGHRSDNGGTVTNPMENGSSGGGGVLTGNPNAVFLFQEALAPATANPSASPNRGGLGNFLQSQMCRHRKRAHSPATNGGGGNNGNAGAGGGAGGGGCGHAFDYVSKRLKRL